MHKTTVDETMQYTYIIDYKIVFLKKLGKISINMWIARIKNGRWICRHRKQMHVGLVHKLCTQLRKLMCKYNITHVPIYVVHTWICYTWIVHPRPLKNFIPTSFFVHASDNVTHRFVVMYIYYCHHCQISHLKIAFNLIYSCIK